MGATATKTRTKTVSEVRFCSASFKRKLRAGTLLTGTPTVTATPSGLTFANKAVNSAAYTDESGEEVGVGQAVDFKVSGGTAGVTYTITVTCDTDSTPAETLVGYLPLNVEA